MVRDIVRHHGYLMIGSRLKRIGERLQAEASQIAAEGNAQVQSRHYAFMMAIYTFGPLTLGDLAASVGITQPGATRVVKELVKLGIVNATNDPNDGRVRIISLTDYGRRQLEHGKQNIWPRVQSAVEDLCSELDGSLLDQLGQLEDALAELPLNRRPRQKRDGQ